MTDKLSPAPSPGGNAELIARLRAGEACQPDRLCRIIEVRGGCICAEAAAALVAAEENHKRYVDGATVTIRILNERLDAAEAERDAAQAEVKKLRMVMLWQKSAALAKTQEPGK